MGCHNNLSPRSSSGHLCVWPFKFLSFTRRSRVRVAAWADCAAEWLKICVGMPAAGLSLCVGALGRPLRVRGLTCARLFAPVQG